MIAVAKQTSSKKSLDADHARFLEMLPTIRRYASLAFRGFNPEFRDELVCEVVANAFVAFARLVEQGRADLAYATPLALFGIKQVRAGRKVGSRLNVRDLSSHYCRSRKGVSLERLDRYDREEMGWQEVLVEDRRAGPAEIAACRIDFSAWLASLPDRNRDIAVLLATSESTTAAARQFGLTAGRVSQLRRELEQDWEAFVADKMPTSPAPAAA